ncbi:sigma-70 family RNA polymerase sigma factor [Nibribacter ruber]|uniref:Sigma-70 family RNA polymerase sigma factor n=1 Tax=Nibribacter ruber TaxID=2698458 RepID=A0A6P1NRN6_9BACT|nr:sigma-70 family RNA polymerase sigma factor [Nibribacter ruber]QHL86486.1 sigma-70 family RNA polymerase sigma factor [Nibribacter ruber]
MIRSKLQEHAEQYMIAALKNGDQSVLGNLYTNYAPVLLGVISRIVQDTAIAEQVLQETFVAIWSRIKLYDASTSRFLTWGLAIARGIAIEAVKTGKFQHLAQRSENSTFALAKESQDQPDTFYFLEPQEKEALELIYLKGYSCQEAAQELGIPEETLKTSLKLAFKHIGAERAA